MKFKIIFLFIVISGLLIGQNQRFEDSLKETIFKSKNVEAKIDKYVEVSFVLRLSNPNEAIRIANEGIVFSKSNKSKKGVAMLLGNLATAYQYKSDYNNALLYGLQSLKIKEELRDTHLISVALNNIALAYDELKNLKLSLYYYNKALQFMMLCDDKNNAASIQNNIGNIYYAQGMYDSALYFFNSAIQTYDILDNKNGKAMVYTNLAGVYFDNGKIDKAIEFDLKALAIREKLNETYEIASSWNNLGFDYNANNLSAKSIEAHLKAIEVIKDHGSKLHIQTAYQGISEAYQKQKDYKTANLYLQKYIDLYKTILNEENQLQVNEMQTKFDSEKKETENKLLLAENNLSAKTIKEQKLVSYFVTIILVTVSLMAFFIFKGLKKQRLANKIISEQKLVVELQKEQVEEKHKEITDSINYAERIQRSFLASEDLLTENLKEHFVFFQPKDVVSGDFYWASKLSNSNFALVTADSTGHGVPGAIMSILNISSLEKAVDIGLNEPSDILNHTRKTIIERLKKDGSLEGGKDGMDCILISFDFNNAKLIYSAANNPIWIVRDGVLIELDPDKMPVGKHDKDFVSFSRNEFLFNNNDMLYTLTDGMPDQFGGPKGKKFMYKKLKELLVSVSLSSIEIQEKTLRTELNNWKGDLEQVDDICVIGIRL